MKARENEDWIGTSIGPWLIKSRFRNSQKRIAYVCEHIERPGLVKGISAYRLRRLLREMDAAEGPRLTGRMADVFQQSSGEPRAATSS